VDDTGCLPWPWLAAAAAAATTAARCYCYAAAMAAAPRRYGGLRACDAAAALAGPRAPLYSCIPGRAPLQRAPSRLIASTTSRRSSGKLQDAASRRGPAGRVRRCCCCYACSGPLPQCPSCRPSCRGSPSVPAVPAVPATALTEEHEPNSCSYRQRWITLRMF
jgi:hypothetical protein